MKEKTLPLATLSFLLRDDKVILSLKTRNIGKGCLNGYGGGIKKAESLKEAAVRELREECKIRTSPEHLKKVAVIDFHNMKSDNTTFVCRVHVYLIYEWTGTPQSTKEMKTPKPFPINNLPLKRMMPADKVWLPLVLKGKKLTARATYTPFQKKLVGKVEIKLVNYLIDE